MEPKQRRQRLLLAGLVAVLAVVLAVQFWPASSPTTLPGPARTARNGAPMGGAPAASAGSAKPVAAMTLEVVNVEIDRLQESLPSPDRTGRDPFRYQARVADAPGPSARPTGRPPTTTGTPGDGGEPGLPPPPPPPPPITLKYIGLLTAEKGVGRVAVLSDGKFVFYGREGDVIEGRYRVVKIGEESIQMEHVDGRGRQTIRLSGA